MTIAGLPPDVRQERASEGRDKRHQMQPMNYATGLSSQTLASSYFPGKRIIIIIGMMLVISIQRREYFYPETVEHGGSEDNNRAIRAITRKSVSMCTRGWYNPCST